VGYRGVVVSTSGVSLRAGPEQLVEAAAGGALRRVDPSRTGSTPGMRDGETVGRHDSPTVGEPSANGFLPAIPGRARQPQPVRIAR